MKSEDLWERESPQTTLIRHSYENRGIQKWNNERIARLSRLIGCDPYELCAIAGVFSKNRIRSLWRKRQVWPPEIALHFANLEAFIYQVKFHSAQPPTAQQVETAKLITDACAGAAESPQERPHHD